jgi:hypothetical protein
VKFGTAMPNVRSKRAIAKLLCCRMSMFRLGD